MFLLNDAKALIKKDDELVTQLFEYWKPKKMKAAVTCLTPTVRTEKKDGSALHDPYVAFRRRIEKMQTRKVSFLSPNILKTFRTKTNRIIK